MNIHTFNNNGAFALVESETDTDTETGTIAMVPNGSEVSLHCEHFRIMICKPFLIGLGLGQCKHTISGSFT